MPVYEYGCSKGHDYERAEGFNAPTRQKCIRCGAPAQRKISMPAVIFKGSGFYSTDSRKSHANGGSSGASEKTEAGTKSPASSEGTAGQSQGADGHSHESPAKLKADSKTEAKAD